MGRLVDGSEPMPQKKNIRLLTNLALDTPNTFGTNNNEISCHNRYWLSWTKFGRRSIAEALTFKPVFRQGQVRLLQLVLG